MAASIKAANKGVVTNLMECYSLGSSFPKIDFSPGEWSFDAWLKDSTVAMLDNHILNYYFDHEAPIGFEDLFLNSFMTVS